MMFKGMGLFTDNTTTGSIMGANGVFDVSDFHFTVEGTFWEILSDTESEGKISFMSVSNGPV